MNKTLSIAQKCVQHKLSVIPVKADGSKAPDVREWEPYQQRIAKSQELTTWFGNGKKRGIALVLGKVSGNLEAIDFDDPSLIEEWCALVEECAPRPLATLPQIETPSGGLHVLYRCSVIQGNQKLARKKDTDGKIETLIETRGEGGYIITIGSPVECHKSGNPYVLKNGSLSRIPTITPEQREMLLSCARSFNSHFSERDHAEPRRHDKSSGLRPGDDFNQRGDTRPLLEKHGWQLWRRGRLGEQWKRPDGTHGSATVFDDGSIFVFSTNACPFESEQYYSPFSIYTMLEHSGDYEAAAKALAAQGYGDSLKTRSVSVVGEHCEQGEGTATTDAGPKDAKDTATITAKLIEIVERDVELFHDAGGDCYGSADINGHRETHRLESRELKDWLARVFWLEEKRAVGSDKIGEVLSVLRAKAKYEGELRETHVRVAEHEGAVYLDLCKPHWQQIKITTTGWQVIESSASPVRFRRANGMLALPTPIAGGSFEDLRKLLNLNEGDDRKDENWPLILAWLIATFKPSNAARFAYPVLAIHGEQGSAKSTTARLLRRLIDPNKADLRATPRDERDLAIAAEHGRILAFDNLTHISDVLSNALCRIATGGGFATRALYSDQDEVIFDSQRPVLLNGISEVVSKSDLLDRAILIYLPRIPTEKRKLDRVIDGEFAKAQPGILGALLEAVSAGLRRMKEGVMLKNLPRMADFAEWSVACEKGLGLEEGEFMKAYAHNIQKANGLALEASPVAQAITAMIEDCKNWEGTTGGLLKALNGRLAANNENPERKHGWPKVARALGAKLKEIAPNLRRSGIEITFGERNRSGYQISLEKAASPQEGGDVHNVHDVHAPNESNDLWREHVREHGSQSTPLDVHTPDPCEHLPLPVNTDVHTDVHTINPSEQRDGEHRERREHLVGTPGREVLTI